jgi:hypothetical protein
MQDRYLKFVLTAIALELLWIGVKDTAVPLAAQQAAQATRVVITGVDIAPAGASQGALPVMVRAGDSALRIQADRPDRPLKVETDRPVTVEGERPLAVTIDRPVRVEADPPLKVEQVRSPPGRIPGE